MLYPQEPTAPPQTVQPAQLSGPTANEQPPPQDTQQKRLDEVRRLKRWAKGKRAPDVDKFDSSILDRDEKMAALDLVEDAAGEDAPFPYP
jgi:hypothetical protein